MDGSAKVLTFPEILADIMESREPRAESREPRAESRRPGVPGAALALAGWFGRAGRNWWGACAAIVCAGLRRGPRVRRGVQREGRAVRYRERTKFEGDSSRLRTAAAGRGDCGAGREEKSGSYVSPLRLSPRPPRPRGWRLLTRTASLESPGTQPALGLRAPRVLQMTGAALRRGGVVLVLALAALAAPLSVAQAQTVSSISFTSSPDSGDTYTRGERIDIKVEFDGSVEISNPHLLRLALRVGSVTEQVSRVSSTSTRSLQFFYTVKQSDLDADGISVPANPLSLNGAAITVPGDPDTAITLTHAGIADDATRKVDGSQVAAPTVQTILFQTTPLMGDTFRRGETIQVNVDFDKTLRVTGQPQLALTIGTSVRNASFVPSPVRSVPKVPWR